MSISRRGFVTGVGMAGVAATMASVALADDAAQAEAGYVVESFDADEVMDADIVVMGVGMSGVAALLEAVQSGLKVVGVEAASHVGGNGALTGMQGGVDSQMAKDAGVHVDTCDIIHDEMVFFNYRISALNWIDCIETSGANIDWMVEAGAEFEGTVDDSMGRGRVKSSHSYKDEFGGNAIYPMVETAQAAGAEVLCDTRGVKLVMNDGAVTGLVCEKADGSTLLINCKAVVFASGGYGSNYDLMVGRGCPPVFYSKSVETNQGDALLMAMAAGGVNVTANSAMLFSNTIPAIDYVEARGLNCVGELLLVNGNGERFTNEACARSGMGCYLNALSIEDQNYILITKNIADYIDNLGDDVLLGASAGKIGTKIVERCQGAEFELDPTIGRLYGEDGPTNVAVFSETLEGIAEQTGMDADTLKATVERYNELCAAGKDLDFGKDADCLMPLDGSDGYFCVRIYPGYATSIGGIKTNRDYSVVDSQNNAIPGLYAVGCDGTMMYRETYTIEVPGSCNMMNVHSGRRAVQHAIANVL